MQIGDFNVGLWDQFLSTSIWDASARIVVYF